MRTYIIIPAYNEEQKIVEVIQGVQEMCSSVIVVDDGSYDNTYEAARATGVLVLRHIVNRGQGAALQTGITYALAQGADIIVTFDADGQHDVDDIPRLIKPIQEGAVDVVLGSRFKMSNVKCQVSNPSLTFDNSSVSQSIDEENVLRNSHVQADKHINQKLVRENVRIPLLRRLVLKLGLVHQWFFTGLKVTDAHCGLRAFSRKAAETIVITQDRMAHASEIFERIAQHKLRYVEVPVHIHYTPYSIKKGQKNFSGSLRVLYDFFMGKVV